MPNSKMRDVAARNSQSSKSAQKKPNTAGFLDLIHPAARHLFKLSPVLWFENRNAYDALLFALHAEYDPASITETILVKDLADCHWELARVQQIKKVAISSQLPASAWKLMGHGFEHNIKKNIDTREFLQTMLRDVVKGSKKALEILTEFKDMTKVSDMELLHEAYTLGLTSISAIDAAIGRIERRRTSLLRTMEQRKSSNTAINKAYFDGMMSYSKGDKPNAGEGGT